MLVLSRKEGQRVLIGDNVVITVNRVSGNRITLGIEAPKDVRVVRGELEIRDGEDLGTSDCLSASELPTDFIAYQLMWLCPRRFVRKGPDDWDVMRWSDRWAVFDNYGDRQAMEEYRQSDYVFERKR